MKNLRFLIMSLIILSSCSQEEFNIGNDNAADAARVLANSADFQNFNISNHSAVAFEQVGFNGVFFRGFADQMSTTNAFRDFWSACDQPRRIIDNSTSNDDIIYWTGGPWSSYNNVINNANIVINNIENDKNTVIVNGNDVTLQELAGAYFDKGVAQGYLSMIYDKAYIVNPDTDITTLTFSLYNEVLVSAIENIKEAISLASSAGSFEYAVYPGGPAYDADAFVKIANSYMARFAMGVARTDAEATGLDYNTILSYANNGITEDFYPISDENSLWNNLQSWSTFLLGDGSGYMPSDIKIAHLFDPSYPTDYPVDESIVLDPAQTNDPRLEMYYQYVGGNFGFLRASRGRHLFSSYATIRFYSDNHAVNGLPVQLFPKAEIDYLKAECYYRLGDYTSAVAILNDSPRMTVGGQTTTISAETVRNALFYENSIELDLNSGMAVNWTFMRRHDLLQAGTPTMYPVPATELEITQDQIYTFGGPSAAGNFGTASGSKDWRTLNLTY